MNATYELELRALAEQFDECFSLDFTDEQLTELLEADVTADNVEDAFFGIFDSIKAFAEELVCEINGLDIPGYVLSHIDWQSMWDCDLRHHFTALNIGGEVLILRRNF